MYCCNHMPNAGKVALGQQLVGDAVTEQAGEELEYIDPETGKKIIYAENVPALLRGELSLSPEEEARIPALQALFDEHPLKLAERGGDDWNLWVKATHERWLVRDTKGETLHVALQLFEDEIGEADFFDKYGIDFTKALKVNGNGLFDMPVSDFSSFVFPCPVSFKKASFGGMAVFDGASFGGDAWFEGARFDGGAKFMQARFGGDADFGKASFGGDAVFYKASFGGEVGFSGASFFGDARFFGARFGGDARFSEASFGGDAVFNGARFGGDVEFDGASFGGDAGFSKAIFGGEAWFEEASFSGDATFYRASFGGDAGFNMVNFGGDAVFDQASFVGAAGFYTASFGGDAWFDEASFGGDAKFDGATFEATSIYRRAEFFWGASWNNSEFVKSATWGEAVFWQAADFQNCRFRASVDLDHATFGQTAKCEPPKEYSNWPEKLQKAFDAAPLVAPDSDTVPNFRGAEFVVAPNLGFTQVAIPPSRALALPPHERAFLPDQAWRIADRDAGSKLRRLQELADKGHHAFAEKQFFRAELLCRRGHEAHGLELVMINAFELISKCGLSFWRPMGWLALFWMPFFMLLYGMVAGLTWDDLTSGGLAELFSYSAANSLPFLGLFKGTESEAVTYLFHDADGIPYWLSVLHNLIATIHIFFALLAIRNYFKLG